MAQRVIDLLEEIQIKLHQREPCARVDQSLNHHVKRPPVAQPGQRIGKGLLFGGDHRPAQPQVQLARCLHRGGFRFHEVKHFYRQIGHRKIRRGQGIIPHRVQHRNAKGQVDYRPHAIRGRRDHAFQLRARRIEKPQIKPLARLGQHPGKIAIVARPPDLEEIQQHMPCHRLIRAQLLQRRPHAPDPPVLIHRNRQRAHDIQHRSQIVGLRHPVPAPSSNVRPSA